MAVFGVWLILGIVGMLMLGTLLFSLFLLVSVPIAGLFYGAPWVRTRKKMIQGMIEMAKISPGEVVMDIGCGDGIILFEVLKQFPATHVIGIDCNPLLIWRCRFRAWIGGYRMRATFLCVDLRTGTIPKADVVMLYLLPPLMEQLRPRLKMVLDPEARIVSNAFRFADVSPRTLGDSDLPIHLYFTKDL